MKPTQRKKTAKRLRRFAQFSGLGLQMGLTIYFAAYFGKKIDLHYHTGKVFTLLLILLAFIYSIWSLIRQLNNINRDDS